MDPDKASTNLCSLVDGRVVGELKAWIGPQTVGSSRHVKVCCRRVIECQRVKLGGLNPAINGRKVELIPAHHASTGTPCNHHPERRPIPQRGASHWREISLLAHSNNRQTDYRRKRMLAP